MLSKLLLIAATVATSARPRHGPPPPVIKLPYTPCGGSCTSDGFAAGGKDGVWVGVVCPPKCAECQSDGILPPVTNQSGLPPALPTNHWCETSPDQMYQHPTSK